MKFKNNYYGKPQFFGKARCIIPMNLQLFAEGGDEGGPNGGGGSSDGEQGGGAGTPTVEELLAQLAQERATNAQNKAALDKALKEKGELTKNLRAKMSAEEQEAEAKKAADEAKDARIQELESKFRAMDYSKRYMGIGADEKTAEALSDLTGELTDVDKFFSTLDKFIQSKTKVAGEDAVQKFLKDRPDVNAGSGTSEKNALAKEKAREAAHRKTGADMSILKHYIPGGMN